MVWLELAGTTSLVADPGCLGQGGQVEPDPPVLKHRPPVENTYSDLLSQLF